MKPNPIPVIAAVLLLSLKLSAQTIPPQRADDSRYTLLLKSGAFIPEKNIIAEKLDQFNRTAVRSTEKSFAVIQFEQIPTNEEKEQLQQSGIQLLDYIPNNAYTVTITGSLNAGILTQVRARAVIELSAIQKMQPELAIGNFPPWAVKVTGTIDVWISFPKSFSFENVSKELHNRNFEIISSLYKDYQIIALRIVVKRLGELALLPFIEYVEAAPGEDKPLNPFWTNWGRDGVRASLLGSPISFGGKNLKGKGVVIGIGDDADPQQHVDFTNRLISRAAGNYNFHGTHVTGILGGAGIRNELRTGFAPKSTIISQIFSKIFINAPAYVTDYGMVITNNSYGDNISECATFGVYDLYSRILDQQAIGLPNLQNVFAAGNSGKLKCTPYPDSFRTVLGGYQSAKNIITVGNATPTGYLFETSSRGPVKDGRIKPEITAVGSFIESTTPPPFNFYGENTGTSMASPAIAGGLALLYEKYRLLHPPGLNPKNGLMKALVCNSGDDWGKPGPDYSHGFGVANFWRAVKMLEDNHYTLSSIAPGPPQTINVNVPAGLAELKIMLYWNDPAAALLASQTLVNDLDLEVVTPFSTTVLPLVLDTLLSNIKNSATNGVDHINNIEQVVIKNPVAGVYTIRVKATNITQNPLQEYFVVYDFVPLETKLVAPIGGESYLQGENMIIRWDSYGIPENTFTLEYSIDNGVNWSILKNNIEADKRGYFYNAPNPNEWFIVPPVTTDKALVRITRNGTGLFSTSLPFTICDTINVSLSAIQCEGYISIDWSSVTGATGYEVMMLQGDEMVKVATVPDNTLNYTFSGLSKDSVYWASVRPLIGTSNSPGRRGIAVSRKPDSGSCGGNISDNDIKIDTILSPLKSGRLFTSTSLNSSVPVTIRIKNLDNNPTSGNSIVSFILNGGIPVTHTIINPGIAGGGTLVYTFPETIDMSAVGTYTLEVSVSQTGDPVPQNNSVIKIYKQLDNPPITGLLSPFVDNFDLASAQSYITPQIGLKDLDRYDFVNSSNIGRIRTFINTGIAYSGSRAITLDASMHNSGTTDSLTGIFNLATFNSATDDIRLDFRYKNHGQLSNPANKVWVRGKDDKNWIEAYDLYANQNEVDGTYKLTSSIEISDLLYNAAPSQSFSTSFQVRWGQYGQQQAADNDGGAGYTFDDIRLYKVTNDLQLISIDTPFVSSCGLGANTPVRVQVKNNANTITSGSVPVEYRVDGGNWITETIPAIAANTTLTYTFTTIANLQVPGPHLLQARVAYPTDSYRDNDTLSMQLVNSPIITVFPYVENFEAGKGSWYSGGKKNSWEYGTPNTTKINKAASGSKAWKTNITGNYNDLEKSYLYSPCFNISGMMNPTLSLSIALDLEDCGNQLCDGAFIEYSTDGKIWNRLGATGQGTNWYNKNYSANNLWSVQGYSRWHVATISLPANLANLRLRIVMASDQSVSKEGIAVDDIHIYDNMLPIYDGPTMSSPVSQSVAGGNSWVNFISNGKVIASIQPNNQNMGNTDVQAYINTAGVRNFNGQYYHNRNISVKPANEKLMDSVGLRIYFLDSESDSLINATGCSGCSKPASFYELGISKYSDSVNQFENGRLTDDTLGTWNFITSSQVTKVPYLNGYYVECKTRDFSEFWLNNGGPGQVNSLRAEFLDFAAKKVSNNNVQLDWILKSENNILRYEIEVAKNNANYQAGTFSKSGEVNSIGNINMPRSYSFTDAEANKSGVRYYRIKVIYSDGGFTYSTLRAVVFYDSITLSVYPNPSNGLFNLVYQLPASQKLLLQIYDVEGRLVQEKNFTANGFLEKQIFDFDKQIYPKGIYLFRLNTGEQQHVFKVIKQ